MDNRPIPPSTARRASPDPHRPQQPTRLLPDLRALETFVSVCDAGSMSTAAQRLGVSQSAISQAIKVLESDYGVRLFDREVRPIRPTRVGKLLLTGAAGLLADARRLGEELRQSARQEHAQIRLGCVDSFAATLGPALIRGLADSARQLQLLSGLTPALNSQLQTDALDLAICTEVPANDARITQRLLFSEGWVAVFPRGGAGARLREARDLPTRASRLPLIRYTQRSVIGQQVERFLRHLGVEAPRRFEFDATDPMLSLVAAGLGWAVTTPLCLWQARAWLDEIDLLAIPPSRLGQRDFLLLCRDAQWCSIADEIVRLTRAVLQHDTLPALRARMPELPAGAVSLPEPDADVSPHPAPEPIPTPPTP